jgi:tetratricopeptide (TPR) repeat protein
VLFFLFLWDIIDLRKAQLNDKIEYARDLMFWGNFEDAKTVLEELQLEDVSNIQVLYQLGICCLALGEDAYAKTYFSTCLDLNPNHLESLLELAEISVKEDDLDHAYSLLEKAVLLDDENPRVYSAIGRLQEQNGNLLDAITNLERSVELSPPMDGPRHDLAMAYAQSRQFLRADLLLQELISEADLGIFWRKLGASEGLSEFVSIEDSGAYQEKLKEERQTIADLFYEETSLPLEYSYQILEALECFVSLDPDFILDIAREIEMIYYIGIDINNSKQFFKLNTLEGEYTGAQLLCYLYTALQMVNPEACPEIDLALAFQEALEVFQNRSE